MSASVLSIRGLRLTYGYGARSVSALDGVDLALARGEALALVGESGSGKSSLALACLGLAPEAPACTVRGSIRIGSFEMVGARERDACRARGAEVAIVFQDPASAFDPVVRIGDQVSEAIVVHGQADRRAARRLAVELLARAGLDDPEAAARAYPHQLSGGMRQRAAIAAAIAARPKLLVLDEPTSALDSVTAARVVDLVSRLRVELGMALLFVTHDLHLAPRAAERIAVLYGGRVVEEGPTAEVLRAPRHPYTLGLLRSAPRGARRGARLTGIRGPAAGPPSAPGAGGCRFAARCDLARPACGSEPELAECGVGRRSACHFAREVPAP